MAIIYTYPRLINLQDQDLLLISDTSSTRKDTMRVELGDLANFLITSKSIITGGGTENYVPIFDATGSGIVDSQLQQSPQLGSGLYQMRFNNADRFIINKPSSITSGDPEYLIQQDGNYKVSFGWDDDGGGFGFIYNWAGNGLRLGAQGQNPQFELNTVVPKIISHTDHEFEGAILDVNGLSGTAGQRLSSTGTGVEWINDGRGTVIINGLVNNLASAGSGGYDFMEFVSNVTGPTQIPVMKLTRAMTLVGVGFVWMGDTALTIGAGEQVEFTIGTIPSGSNPIIGNYTSASVLFTLDSSVSGTWANGNNSGLTTFFNAGDIIAVVGQETGTVTPNTGELGITLDFITQ